MHHMLTYKEQCCQCRSAPVLFLIMQSCSIKSVNQKVFEKVQMILKDAETSYSSEMISKGIREIVQHDNVPLLISS